MIDVVICVKNPVISDFETAIKHIKKQEELNNLIIVVNEESTPESKRIAEKEGNVVAYENSSLAHARMLGIKLAETELFSFVDHDVLIPNNFYKACLRYMNEQVGAVNGYSWNTEKKALGIPWKEKLILTKADRGVCTAN